MQAVEFEADVTNGVIQLPAILQRNNPSHLKIIALFSDTQKTAGRHINNALNFIDKIGQIPLNWENDKMTREQMNER